MTSSLNLWLIAPRYWLADTTPALRLNTFAKAWHHSGHSIRVFTTPPLGEDGILHNEFSTLPNSGRHEVEGVCVHSHAVPQPALTVDGRLTWPAVLTFSAELLKNLYAPKGAGRPSVILTSFEEPLVAAAAWLLSVRYRVPLVADWSTPNLNTAEQTGQLSQNNARKLLRFLQAFVAKRCKRIITATSELKADLIAQNFKEDLCRVVPSAVSDTTLKLAESARGDGSMDALRNDLQLSPLTKIVLYYGPHTLPFALGQIIDTARLMLGRPNVLFLFAGSGPDKQRLKKLAAGMPNIQFIGSLPQHKRLALMGLSHVCLMTHRDIGGARQVVPARLLEYLATGTATVIAGGGASHAFGEISQGVLTVPAEAPEDLARAVEQLLDNPTRATELSEAGKAFVQEQCLASTIAPEYWRLIEEVTP